MSDPLKRHTTNERAAIHATTFVLWAVIGALCLILWRDLWWCDLIAGMALLVAWQCLIRAFIGAELPKP